MDGINFESAQSRVGAIMSQQIFNEIDEIDGVKDGQVSKSVFDTLEDVVRLYNSNSNRSEWKAWLDNAGEVAQKVGKILVKAYDQAEDVKAESEKSKNVKNKKKNKDPEPPEVSRMQEIADELILKMETAAKDKKDMFSNDVTKIKNFPIGVIIKHFGINVNYDNSENDELNIDLQDGKVTTIRKPDGLEISIQFNINGQSYTVKSFSKNEQVLMQLEDEEELAAERDSDISVTVNGVTHNDT